VVERRPPIHSPSGPPLASATLIATGAKHIRHPSVILFNYLRRLDLYPHINPQTREREREREREKERARERKREKEIYRVEIIFVFCRTGSGADPPTPGIGGRRPSESLFCPSSIQAGIPAGGPAIRLGVSMLGVPEFSSECEVAHTSPQKI